MKSIMKGKLLVATIVGLAFLATMFTAAFAAPPARNGTTLAGYKTLDICKVDDTPGSNWIYSGEVAVWNQGAVDTVGFAINDCLQSKLLTGGFQFADVSCQLVDTGGAEIPAGTTQLTATTFLYSFEGAPLPVDLYGIRNVANMTITNHSGQLGTPFGPSPKATWTAGDPPVCELENNLGCTYTQGYWGSKPNIVWPSPYDRDATFFLATKQVCILNCNGNPANRVFETQPKTWQEVMDSNVSLSQGYYQLAHQYIAAVLNIAKAVDPAVPPQGVQDTLDLALSWLTSNGPAACLAGGSCGDQKNWAAVLGDFNNGIYEGGPPHCTDE